MLGAQRLNLKESPGRSVPVHDIWLHEVRGLHASLMRVNADIAGDDADWSAGSATSAGREAIKVAGHLLVHDRRTIGHAGSALRNC